MTVVSAMKFNREEGAMVADEQSSDMNRQRKSDISTKIHEHRMSETLMTLMGGSGTVPFLDEVIHSLPKMIEHMKGQGASVASGDQLAVALGMTFSNVKRKYMAGLLSSRYGLSEQEIQSGRTISEKGGSPLDTSIMAEYAKMLEGMTPSSEWIINNYMLALIRDAANGVKLYTIYNLNNQPVPEPRPYGSIGSGSDTADGALYNFFENIPREQRENIDPIEGIAALLHATERASARNVGVGGTPLVSIVQEGKVITPSEVNTRLAAEIVKGANRGYLSHEFKREALQSLMYENGDFKVLESKMWGETPNQKRLSLMLRGYKV